MKLWATLCRATQYRQVMVESSNKTWSTGAQAGIKIARWNINNLRYADGITFMAEKELKSLLMKVKEESEEVSLKLNIQKTKMMASGPITSWEIDGVTVTGSGKALQYSCLGNPRNSMKGSCSPWGRSGRVWHKWVTELNGLRWPSSFQFMVNFKLKCTQYTSYIFFPRWGHHTWYSLENSLCSTGPGSSFSTSLQDHLIINGTAKKPPDTPWW